MAQQQAKEEFGGIVQTIRVSFVGPVEQETLKIRNRIAARHVTVTEQEVKDVDKQRRNAGRRHVQSPVRVALRELNRSVQELEMRIR